MDPVEATLTGVLLPAVISGLVLALGWRIWSREPRGSGAYAGALAIALAYLAAFAAIVGSPASLLPGSERTPSGLDWLFWLVALFALGFAFEARCPRRWIVVPRAVAGALLVEGVLRNTFRREWSGLTDVAWLLGLVALLLVPWWSLERLARKRPGASAPLVLWASAASLAGVAGLSGSVKLAQLSGAVAAALGAAVVLSWWRPRVSLSGGGVAVALLVLFGLGLNAHFYSYTTATDVLLLAAGPVMPLLMSLPGLPRLAGGRAAWVTLGLAAVPLGIALVRALLAYEPDPYAGYYE